MNALISCTSCRRQLRLPDEALGKSVKCPLCGSIFAAQNVDSAAATKGPVSPTPPPAAPPNTSPAKLEQASPGNGLIHCASCRGQLRVPPGALGKSIKCPLCGQVFVA